MDRLRGLDGLRGIAALLVFVQHFLSTLGQQWAEAVISTVDLGQYGVALFFLISGFVIPFSFRGSLAVFAVRRAARLLPALWLSILFCLALGETLTGGTQLFANAFMVAHWMGQDNLIGPYWTLNWELNFYCIMAVVFVLGGLKSPRTFGLLAIGFAAVAILYSPWYGFLLYMFTGTLLRMVMLEGSEDAKPWLCVTIGLLAAVFSLWAIGARTTQDFVGFALAVPTFLLLWKRATHPALIWLGGISYSLYLFHLPILKALAGLPTLTFVALGLALPFLIAAAAYRWVEKPMIAWGKAISVRFVARPATAAVTS